MFRKHVIGLMSGTSLDGLDICYCTFEKDDNWTYSNIIAETVPYNNQWRQKLGKAITLDRESLMSLDREFGDYLAKKTGQFIDKNGLRGKVDLICSHGHTVHHQPQVGITVQIGDGQRIANHLKLPVIYDFRSADVALGGQGAPIVPIGDEYLFYGYDACLNLGGIANISLNRNSERIAFDISPTNLPLNEITRTELGVEYDRDGAVAASGKIITALKDSLDQLDYYQKTAPKSLGVEWLHTSFYPILENFKHFSAADRLKTITDHETDQIAQVFESYSIKNVLITGGGALNSFFIKTLKTKTKTKIHVPNRLLVDFKEALIFGFLGVLHARNEINTLRSVTGARRNSIGGRRVEPL